MILWNFLSSVFSYCQFMGNEEEMLLIIAVLLFLGAGQCLPIKLGEGDGSVFGLI